MGRGEEANNYKKNRTDDKKNLVSGTLLTCEVECVA
jgi:hypothetical protein